MTRAFFDSNILVYAYSDDPRAERSYALLAKGGVVSVQSLNELANVLRRKQGRSWAQVRGAVESVMASCGELVVLDDELHRLGLRVAERYQLSVYDGMIVAAALTAGCDVLYSEDMHHGLVVDGALTIVDPFA